MKPQLTIEAFADWCEKQPAERKYPFMSMDDCACAQYAKALGIGNWVSASTFWRVAEDIALDRPWTFGALAARLRAAQ
ncbi:hypothetical protein FJ973_29790 [Mesorhizobium sp. B2-1-3]|uniref:hypothetical protein n=1 Tax=Mesorhizobium sp. B2-1-3 TaxID=2589972 RepID=UPI00112CCB85|nr:hypothetical protein [Mesorhizobium sp. B2-1-3]TPN03837.1 hypothetical protein FJ973_29790 [Mesorhizobium sp. B2-1-3]